MSLSLTAAKQYVLRVLGGRDNADLQTEAGEAIAAAMELYSQRHNWSWLLRDTSQPFTMGGDTSITVTSGDATVTSSTANAFKDILVGMTIADDESNIPAGTTVASVTDGASPTLEMSVTATGNGTDPTLTLGGTIPIIAGTASYTLPDRVFKPYTCRLVSAENKPLRYIPHKDLDYVTADQTVQGSVFGYTFYDGADFDASGTQQHIIKFWRVPDQADVALLKYYRAMDSTADPLDCKDEYQYALLAQARAELLRTRSATDRRIPIWERTAERRLIQAIDTDFDEGGDDQLPRLQTPDEVNRGGVLSGEFFPSGDIPWGYW